MGTQGTQVEGDKNNKISKSSQIRNKKNLRRNRAKKQHYKNSTDAWWTCIMVQIAHIIREGEGQLLAPNDLKSLVPPNLDHWHPPLILPVCSLCVCRHAQTRTHRLICLSVCLSVCRSVCLFASVYLSASVYLNANFCPSFCLDFRVRRLILPLGTYCDQWPSESKDPL